VQNTRIGAGEAHLVRSRSATSPGRIPAKRLGDAEELVLPCAIGLCQDTGLQGDHPAAVHMYQPQNKPPGQELTPEEQAEDTSISRSRSLMEHRLAGVKRCRMVKDVFRHTNLYCADQVMEIAYGLQNFRTTLRYNTLE
jgi:hypothetical protein